MSGTMLTLSWTVIVDADSWNLTEEQLAQAEEFGFDDLVEYMLDQLRSVMTYHGNEFIRNHPEMFRGELV